MENGKIIGILKPFQLNQELYVYKGDSQLEKTTTDIENFPKMCINLIKKYKYYDIDLVGPSSFSLGIKRNINKEMIKENTSFKNEINIKII